MDFWKIVGIVLLISAVSGLLVLVGELREKQNKKQAEKKKPVQPMEPPKQSKQEEMKPQTVKTEPQKEQRLVRETISEKTVQQEPIQLQEKKRQSEQTEQEKVQPPVQEKPVEKEECPEGKILSGECGDGMTCRKEGGTLYIEGQGEIEDYAFYNDSSVRKVVIAEGCTGIGESAFAHCDKLEEVEMPKGLLCIGKEAFQSCTALTKVTLPDGLQEIGEDAFYFCEHKDLKLHIPDSVTEIGEKAFAFVPEIYYHGPAWDALDWGAWEWVDIHESCDSGSWKIWDNTLYVYVNGELPLKEFEVRSIHHRFSETEIRSPWDPYNDRFEHVVIAPGCTKIPRDSFCYCRNLKTISIPDTVKGIEEYAFYGCKRLTSIEIPDSVTEIGVNAFEDVPCVIYNGPAQSDDNWGAGSWLRVEDEVLHIACRGPLMSVPQLNVKEVVIHEGCTDIEAFTFKDWDHLQTVHTPFSLCHIDQNAFSGCHDVTLNMCNTRPVWNSPNNVFSGVYCVNFCLPHRIEGDTLWIGPDDGETPYILQMRDDGVYGMNWMEPDTWERYKGYPWGSRVINKIRAAVIAPGCQEIDESVFWGHTALETVKIPMGVRKIGMHAFAGCENLKDLEIPDSVTEIGRDAFRGVPNIIYHGPAQSDDNWGAKSRN